MDQTIRSNVRRMTTRVTKKLMPGQPGTLRWKDQFGDKLLCVRYRLDERGEKRYTTVEILVDVRRTKKKPPAQLNRLVFVRTNIQERALQKQIKEVGGKWNHQESLWMLPYANAKALNLLSRIVRNVDI